MAAKRFRTFNLDFMNTCSPSPRLRETSLLPWKPLLQAEGRQIKMAMSDVDVSSSLDHDEEPLAELADEELYNLVQETL